MTTPVLVTKVSTYVTGHCGIGNHEGTKNLSTKGTLFPACAGEYAYSLGVHVACTCWCHEMFKMAAASRASALADVGTDTDTPETSASVEIEATSAPTGTAEPAPNVPKIDPFWSKVLEHQDLTLQVYRFVSWHVFGVKGDKSLADRTVEGRRPRGSLDINVEAICRLKFEGRIPNELTPQTVGLLIDPINPPSAGAIHAVFTRWKNAGYCTLSERPVMMTGFTSLVGADGITGAKKVSLRQRVSRAKGFFV